MSRTRRRNNRDLIILACGHKHDVDDWDRERWPGRTDEIVYAKRVNVFLSDASRGQYGIPRWFRRLHWTRPTRRGGRREIIRCLQQGDWDDHLPTPLKGDTGRHGYYY